MLTDHKLIYLSGSSNNILHGKRPNTGYWKFNGTLLKDKQFLDTTKSIIKESWTRGKTLNSYSGQWELMKYKIRRLAIQRGKDIAKHKHMKEDGIVKEIIMIYEKNQLSQEDKINITKLQLELDQLYEERAK